MSDYIDYDIDELKRGIWRWRQQDFTCRICGQRGERENRPYSHVLDICTTCAEVIRNLYDLGHGGDFELWPSLEPKFRDERQPIPKKIRWAVFQRDDFTCRHCGAQEDLQADHMTPLFKGGPTEMANLQTLCGPCNLRKFNEEYREWKQGHV